MRPQPRMQNKKAYEHSHHGHTGVTRHSPRNGFNGFLRALPSDRAFLPLSPAEISTSLTPASGRQDHTTSPSASAPFVSSTAGVHRIPRPTFVTTAKRPSLWARDGGSSRFDLPEAKAECFFKQGWTAISVICPSGTRGPSVVRW